MLETGKDMDPQSREILETFVWWGAYHACIKKKTVEGSIIALHDQALMSRARSKISLSLHHPIL